MSIYNVIYSEHAFKSTDQQTSLTILHTHAKEVDEKMIRTIGSQATEDIIYILSVFPMLKLNMNGSIGWHK